MIPQGHIGNMEAIVLTAVAVSAKVFLSEPAVAAEWVGTSAALVAFLNGLVTMGLAWMALSALDPAREEGLVEQFERLAGILGTLFGGVLAGTLLGVTALGLRELGGQLLATVLPKTPSTVVEGAAVVVFAYAAYLGLEVIARAAMVLAVPTVLGTLFLIFMAFPRVDFTRLFPVLGYGWRPTLIFSLVSGWYREAWVAAVSAVYLRERRRQVAIAVQGVAVSVLVITVVNAFLLAMFGFPSLIRFPFPTLEGARSIYAGEFVSNLESIFLFLFVMAIFLLLSITFWTGSILVADLLHLPEHRPLIPVLAVGTWLFAYLPPSLMDAIHWVDHDLRQATSIVVLPGIFLFWALGLWRRRRERQSAA